MPDPEKEFAIDETADLKLDANNEGGNNLDYTSETGYHSRSHFPCESGDQCVPEDAICGGVALCRDKSDLEMCEELDCIYPMLPCSANNSSSTNCYHIILFMKPCAWHHQTTQLLFNIFLNTLNYKF